MNVSPIKVQQKHYNTLMKLHKAILACVRCFFSGWNVPHDGWVDSYLTDIGPRSKW